MILGNHEGNAANCLHEDTFNSTIHLVEIDGKTYNLHDTVGLEERSGGTVDSAKAVGNLYHLVTELSNAGGINLLVFVIKCGKCTETMRKNYNLLYHGFCDTKVPIIIVVTGCENVEPTMDTWWVDNEASFTMAGMSFNGHACVCAFKGASTNTAVHRNEGLVKESVEEVKQLIVQHCKQNGWKKVCHPHSLITKLKAHRNTPNLATSCLA